MIQPSKKLENCKRKIQSVKLKKPYRNHMQVAPAHMTLMYQVTMPV